MKNFTFLAHEMIQNRRAAVGQIHVVVRDQSLTTKENHLILVTDHTQKIAIDPEVIALRKITEHPDHLIATKAWMIKY